MRCAATTRCSRPPKASSGCGKCRSPCWNLRRQSGSTRRVHGDRNQFTSSSPPMPGACPSREPGATPTAWAAKRAGLHRIRDRVAKKTETSDRSRGDDVKNLSQIWAVAPALVKLALRDDRRSQTDKEPPWKRIAKGLG